jgi:hypothetical protein
MHDDFHCQIWSLVPFSLPVLAAQKGDKLQLWAQEPPHKLARLANVDFNLVIASQGKMADAMGFF